MIVTVGGIKGGTGKSTVATNLAVWLAQGNRGFKSDVLLVDADEQGTATDFAAMRNQVGTSADSTLVDIASIQLTGLTLKREIDRQRKKYDHIVIDVGGSLTDTQSQRAAMFVADLFLVPFQSRSPDVWTSTLVVELLAEVNALRSQDLPAYCFLNRADVRSADNRDASEALQALEGITFLDAQLSNRKAYSNAIGAGLCVTELLRPDPKASKEVNHLFSLITQNKMYDTHHDKADTKEKAQ